MMREGLEAALKLARACLDGSTGQSDRDFGYRLAAFKIAHGIETLLVRLPPPKEAEAETEAARVARSPGRRAGGLARAAAMTPERRSEVATKAARARWSKGA
jgi:hypothetical protein